MNASVVPRGQNGHSDALVVASLFELTDDLGDLSVGPGAEIDLGHPLLLDLFLSCVQRNLSELRVLGIVRILDEKAVARLKVFVTALFSIAYYSSQVRCVFIYNNQDQHTNKVCIRLCPGEVLVNLKFREQRKRQVKEGHCVSSKSP